MIQRTELLNGLHLLTAEVPGEDRVIVDFLIKSGFGMDSKKKPGVAYQSARAVLEANEKVEPQRWKDELESLGATIVTLVNSDSTLFRVELPFNNLEPFLGRMASILVHPLFQKSGFDQLKVKIRELYTELPTELQASLLLPSLFGKGYCSHPFMGEPEGLERITLTDIVEFHSTYYVPNNTAISMVGPPGVSSLAGIVREKFGGWSKGSAPRLPDSPVSSLLDSDIHVFERKNSTGITLLFANPGPARQTPDYYSLVLVNYLLGGGAGKSRLDQEFHRRGILYQFVGSELRLGLVCGMLMIRAEAPLPSIKLILETIPQVIDGLKGNKISEPDLVKLKLDVTESFQKKITSLDGLANWMTEMELYNLSRDLLLSFPAMVEQTSAERLQETARNYLNPRGAVVILGEKIKIEAAMP